MLRYGLHSARVAGHGGIAAANRLKTLIFRFLTVKYAHSPRVVCTVSYALYSNCVGIDGKTGIDTNGRDGFGQMRNLVHL